MAAHSSALELLQRQSKIVFMGLSVIISEGPEVPLCGGECGGTAAAVCTEALVCTPKQ